MGPLSRDGAQSADAVRVRARGLTVEYARASTPSATSAAQATNDPNVPNAPRTGSLAPASSSGAAAPPPTPGLHAVDLDAHRGQVLGILGPNGSGKSTLLRVLATLLRPTSGSLRLLGRDAFPSRASLRRRIGYAGDAPVHWNALSGRENALFFARAAASDPAASAAAERAVETLARRFELAADLDRPAGEYSLGMRRKLLLIEALAAEPPLVLLDEPTLGLDASSLDSALAILRERARTGSTVVLATNHMGFARRACDRIVFLHRGRAVLRGAPEDLLRRSGARTRIDVRLRDSAPELPGLSGAELRSPRPDRLLVYTDDGARLLPRLTRTLIDENAAIESIRIREPDLRDVFTEATGAALTADGADGGVDREAP